MIQDFTNVNRHVVSHLEEWSHISSLVEFWSQNRFCLPSKPGNVMFLYNYVYLIYHWGNIVQTRDLCSKKV